MPAAAATATGGAGRAGSARDPAALVGRCARSSAAGGPVVDCGQPHDAAYLAAVDDGEACTAVAGADRFVVGRVLCVDR